MCGRVWTTFGRRLVACWMVFEFVDDAGKHLDDFWLTCVHRWTTFGRLLNDCCMAFGFCTTVDNRWTTFGRLVGIRWTRVGQLWTALGK